MKLARRLTLVLALVLCAVFALDTVLHVRGLARLYRADAERDERLLARALVPVFTAEWSARGEAAAQGLLESAQHGERAVRVRFVHTDGGAFGISTPDVDPAAWRAPAGDTAPRSVVRNGPDGPRLYTYAPVEIPGAPPGAIEISESLDGEQAFVASRVRGSGAAGLMMLGSAVVFTWLAGRWIVGAPVQALVDKARRTADGDFSQPVAPRGTDELAALGREMDAMAAKLEESRRRLAAETTARLEAVEQTRRAERLSTVGTLAAGFAHELGTPLAIVTGQAHRIASHDVAGENEAAALARSVLDQADRMAQIVRRLLDFARGAPVDKRPDDLASCTRQTVGLLSALGRARGVELTFHSDGPLPEMRFDGRRIQQAIANLVVNAVHACERGGHVRVSVARCVDAPSAALEPAHCLAVDVTDDGVGIPSETLPRIFDPFFSTKPEGEGTGLGLSVAHGIVTEHGGWIDVESTPGRGSRFGIRLPVDELHTKRGDRDDGATRDHAPDLHSALG